MNKSSKDNEISSNDIKYSLPSKLKKTLPLAGLFFLLIGFVNNFKLASTVQSAINKNLKLNKSCQPKIGSTEIEHLTLGLNFSDLVLGDKCPEHLSILRSVYLGFRGISFSPLGLRLKVMINLDGFANPIEFILGAGPSGFKVVIDEQKAEINRLLRITDAPIKAKGIISADGLISGTYSKINKGNIEFNIKKIQFPKQEIEGLILPALALQENVINISFSQKNNITLNSIKLGDKGDPAEVLAQGEVKSPQSLKTLSLDIEGKFNFSDELNNDIPLLGLMLSGKKKSQGYYQFELKGGAKSPKFKVK